MKLKNLIITSLLLLGMLTAKAQDTSISAFLIKWENSEQYLLAIAEAMPEAQYNFKPTERQMTFGDQLLHIANNINWLSSTYFGGQKITKYEGITKKEQIIEKVKDAFANAHYAVSQTTPEALKETITFKNEEKARLQILNLLQDHVTHHRGQLIVYLNLNHITPPGYTGW